MCLLTILFQNVALEVLASMIPGCPNSRGLDCLLPPLFLLVQPSSFTLFSLYCFSLYHINLHLCANDFQIIICNYELSSVSLTVYRSFPHDCSTIPSNTTKLKLNLSVGLQSQAISKPDFAIFTILPIIQAQLFQGHLTLPLSLVPLLFPKPANKVPLILLFSFSCPNFGLQSFLDYYNNNFLKPSNLTISPVFSHANPSSTH